MSDEVKDAEEFVSGGATSGGSNSSVRARNPFRDLLDDDDDGRERRVKPGKPSQYSLYGPGYKATTPTVESLSAGQYDIEMDNNGVFVTPSAPPTGLLLELPEMRSEEIVNIVDNFWNSEKDYKEGNDWVKGGASYKAGIMIYGPPGTGKSCTIKIISKKLIERGGIVLYANISPIAVQKFLLDFRQIEPKRKCIVILEDIDTLIENYGEYTYLEMLDSAKSIDNVLFIATTNYPDRLDARIYNRPGRFSSVVKVGLPGPKAREAFLKAILKKHDDVDYIVKNSNGFSIDHLSALINAIYREDKDMDTELARLRVLFRIPKSTEDRVMGFGNGESNEQD